MQKFLNSYKDETAMQHTSMVLSSVFVADKISASFLAVNGTGSVPL